ncbi:hypothetical protein PMIN07_011664 [Paraphaeosphaeria minitans]
MDMKANLTPLPRQKLSLAPRSQRPHERTPKTTTMRSPLISSSTAIALTLRQPPTAIPVPAITNISYWGSACPPSGLTYAFPPSDTTLPAPSANSTRTPLAFTLSHFSPSFASFGSSLRMCNAVVAVAVAQGWKLVVNGKATTAQGAVEVPAGARFYLRGSWAWAADMGSQSVGMFDTAGPLAGPFAHLLAPVEGSEGGVESGCAGGEQELDVEFQARAVNDTDTFGWVDGVRGTADAAWTLTTDVEAVRC